MSHLFLLPVLVLFPTFLICCPTLICFHLCPVSPVSLISPTVCISFHYSLLPEFCDFSHFTAYVSLSPLSFFLLPVSWKSVSVVTEGGQRRNEARCKLMRMHRWIICWSDFTSRWSNFLVCIASVCNFKKRMASLHIKPRCDPKYKSCREHCCIRNHEMQEYLMQLHQI